MSVTTFIATRYLRTDRRVKAISWITTLSTLGIAIGVAAMICVLSVINGFEDELRDRFLAANAHVLAYRFPAGMKNYEGWETRVRDQFRDDVTGVSPFVHAETMIRNNAAVHATQIRGISPQKRVSVQNLGRVVRPSDAMEKIQEEVNLAKKGLSLEGLPAIIIGSRLMKTLKVSIGETVELVAPKLNSDDPLGDFKVFEVVGVYDSGLIHYDSKLAIMSIPAAQNLFSMERNKVTGLEIGLKEPNDSVNFVTRFLDRYDLNVNEWQSFNKSLFQALSREKSVIGFLVALVAFVASFNILTTLFVLVTQKHRDISILKALGATNNSILLIFLKQSALIGLLGSIAGSGLAFALMKWLEHYPIVEIPDVYMLAKLPVEYNPMVYLAVTASTVLIAVFAGIYPARTAAKVMPALGLTKQ